MLSWPRVVHQREHRVMMPGRMYVQSPAPRDTYRLSPKLCRFANQPTPASTIPASQEAVLKDEERTSINFISCALWPVV